MHELVDEARLPPARLTNERCDLAMSRPPPLQRLLLRFERIQRRHYGMKLLGYTMIHLRAFCGI